MKVRAGRPHIFYGWRMVAASFLMFILCGGTYYYGFTAFFNPMVDEFGWSYAATSLAFSLRNIENSFLAPLVGVFIDKFGPRSVALCGVVLLGSGLLLMSRVTSIWLFYAAFLISSLGATAGFGPAQYAAAANWFDKRRSLAMGILSSGYGVSGVLAPLIVLLIASLGWRMSLLIIAIMVWTICAPASILLRREPKQYGMAPDGRAVTEEELDQVAAGRTGPDLGVRDSLKTRTFWMLAAFSAFTGFAQSAMSAHEIPYLTSVGISRRTAALAMTGITLNSLTGRLGFPALSSRVRKEHLLAVAATLQLAGVLVFAFVGAGSPWLLIPFLLFYGPGFGAPIPLTPALQAEYFGLGSFATIQGLLSIGWTISGVSGPLLAGWIYDRSGAYRPAWIVMAALSAGGTVIALKLRPPAARQRTLRQAGLPAPVH